MQNQAIAKLRDFRPSSTRALQYILELELADDRPPSIGGHLLLQHAYTIRIEPIVAKREAIVVILARAAELHRDHQRVARNFRARPANRLGIDRLADRHVEQIIVNAPAESRAADEKKRECQRAQAHCTRRVNRAEDDGRISGKKETRIPPRLVRTEDAIEEEERPEPERENEMDPFLARADDRVDRAGDHERREKFGSPSQIVQRMRRKVGEAEQTAGGAVAGSKWTAVLFRIPNEQRSDEDRTADRAVGDCFFRPRQCKQKGDAEDDVRWTHPDGDGERNAGDGGPSCIAVARLPS